ncbi:MAG TPA: acylphosphatase [Acidiferrobacter sp.]|nr:acylphosphatase [Acidiferrobacter sp.]
MECFTLIVSGTVQGVGFRAFVQREGQGLGLTGWVRNRPNGTVEILVCGSVARMQALEAAVAIGPRGARVTRVDRRPAQADPVPIDFSVRRDASAHF